MVLSNTRCSDWIFPYIYDCIVRSQWSYVEAGATGFSARFYHRQSGQAAPGPQTRLNYAVNRSIPSSSKTQLLHDSGFLCWERGASPCGWERGVHELTHFLPGPGRFVRLPHPPASCAVLGTAGQLLRAACWFPITCNNWKTTTDLSDATLILENIKP